ncbi:MAG: hypothetical protein KAI64_05410, partial [Thermoplasmata archaeon]|nr:hypothetical protein [Thermoplasmata archaeon]
YTGIVSHLQIQFPKEFQDTIARDLPYIERGGAGSGHHGHEGRLGEVGGSLPSGAVESSELTESQQESGDHVVFMWGNKSFTQLEPGNFWIVPDGRITGDIPDHGMAISFNRAFPLGFVRGISSPRSNEIFFDFRGGTLSDAAIDSIENISNFYTNLGVEIGADIQNPDWKPGDDAIEIIDNPDDLMKELGRATITRSDENDEKPISEA